MMSRPKPCPLAIFWCPLFAPHNMIPLYISHTFPCVLQSLGWAGPFSSSSVPPEWQLFWERMWYWNVRLLDTQLQASSGGEEKNWSKAGLSDSRSLLSVHRQLHVKVWALLVKLCYCTYNYKLYVYLMVNFIFVHWHELFQMCICIIEHYFEHYIEQL